MKHFIHFHCLWVCAVWAVAFVPLPGDAANITLQNPGFATVPDSAKDWTLSGGAARSTSSIDTHGYALTFAEDKTPVNTWAAAAQTLVAAPGQQWTFSAWVLQPSSTSLHEDPADYALLEIRFITASGGSTVVQSPALTANYLRFDRWTNITQVAVAPANTVEVTFSARFFHADPWGTGRIYFDDFSANGVPPVPEPKVVWAALSVLLLAIWVQRRIHTARA